MNPLSFDLSSGLGLTDVPIVTRDIFDRIRAGLAISGVRNPRIDSEAKWYASNPEFIERTFTRAAPYLQYIVEQVEARGMPMEIALLPVIESAFEPYAYSRARAAGLWQFIPATGSRFELKQDWWYDGRRDLVAATQAALDYLQYLHDMFDGDWLLAIGAYNCGEGNVSRAIRSNRAAGRKTDFFSLRLPAETRGYVPRLLAMSRLVANPEQYGLVIEGIPDLPYFRRVETGGQINMAVAAELAGITTEEMYVLNPAHHRWATDPSGPHFLLVPEDAADTFTEGLLQLTPDQRMRVERYTVREGDTVNSVASRFGTTAQHLRELNGLNNANALQAGSELRVPSSVTQLPEKVLQAAARVDRRPAAGVRAVHVVRKGESMWIIAQRHGLTVNQLARLNHLSQSATLRPGQRLRLSGGTAADTAQSAVIAGDGKQVTYVVRRGDTLSQIARALKVSVASLRSWNGLAGDALQPGQRLVAYVAPSS
ncbi:MAG: LysM peptidoglycan-binding domain-containing protein [Steroidobacteraceae bacterium]